MASLSELNMFNFHHSQHFTIFDGDKDEARQFFSTYGKVLIRGKSHAEKAENLAAHLRGEAFKF